MDPNLRLLENIHPVAAPPFLLTRIRQRIEADITGTAPLAWRWGLGMTFVLVIMLNTVTIYTYTQHKSDRHTPDPYDVFMSHHQLY
ncbi:MAG: hypothetical protein SF053_02185 [Bacteroidia bacterium]|nr:hypothetical protein [Bacteroidia bacterium]